MVEHLAGSSEPPPGPCWAQNRLSGSVYRMENIKTLCSGLNCVLPNPYVEALASRVTVFEDGSFEEVMETEGGPKGGALV